MDPEKKKLLEAAHTYFVSKLWTKEGAETLSYLHGRGYSNESIKSMGLGYNPGFPPVEKYLNSEGFMSTQIDLVLAHMKIRDEYPLVIPDMSKAGIRALWKRRIDSNSEAPKYLPLSDAKKNELFGFKGDRDVLLVEGVLDALTLQSAGFPGACALQGASNFLKPLEAALKSGARSFTLALDNDAVGQSAAENVSRFLTSRGIRNYVLPEYPEKDPDELLSKRGIPEFKKILASRVSGASWLLDKILTKHDMTNLDGQDAAMEAAIGYLQDIPVDSVERVHVYNSIFDRFHLPKDSEIMRQLLEFRREKKAGESLNRGLRDLLRNASKLSFEGKQEELLDLLEEGVSDLKLRRDEIRFEPPLNFSTFLQEKKLADDNRDPDNLLGYRLSRFAELAKNLDGVQPGYYILAADTNVGKTAFMANLFLDILKTTPDTVGVYFSLDDPRKVIADRFLAILSGLHLSDIQRPQTGQKGHFRDLAYEDLTKLAEDQRLFVYDIAEVASIARVEAILRPLHREKLFVFIDGLLNLEVGDFSGNIREENERRARRIKALSDRLGIPICTTVEITKEGAKNLTPALHDLKETGKFAYNANVVWLLYPEESSKNDPDREEMDLVLKFAKNKISSFKGSMMLHFRRGYSAITEVPVHGNPVQESRRAETQVQREPTNKKKMTKNKNQVDRYDELE
jgi:replicative DNA helicase